MIELLSIDLSNRCSKQCPFCYNGSSSEGAAEWKVDEVIAFALDCIKNGVRAVSLGGGEPFEYQGVFEVIEALNKKAYLSVTTNGLPLQKPGIWENLMRHAPDKIHITIHFPDNQAEIERVTAQIKRLAATPITPSITPGVNLLVDSTKLTHCTAVYQRLREILEPKQIILVPLRYSNTPSPKELAQVAGNEAFQSPSCLLGCKRPVNFASVSWDKRVNSCSFAGGKEPLKSLNYNGLMNALKAVRFTSCS